MTENCIFCDIAARRVPAEVVAEAGNVLAFRDTNPAAPSHVLMIPKMHIADSAADLDGSHNAILGELFAMAARVARIEALDDGWRLVSNIGPAAGQTVLHLHFHILGGWDDSRTASALNEETGG